VSGFGAPYPRLLIAHVTLLTESHSTHRCITGSTIFLFFVSTLLWCHAWHVTVNAPSKLKQHAAK